MAGVQGSALAIAVSNSGALGSLPCAMLSLEEIRGEIATIQAHNKPFNVNFFCHQPPPTQRKREKLWRKALSPYYREFGIMDENSSLVVSEGPSKREPFNSELADMLSEFKPPIVSFHFGLPSPELITRIKSWGAKILSSATTADEARWLEDRGVDAIIAQGFEAGGHRGMFLSKDITTQVGTFALLPQILHAVKKCPVIAAGGIGDAKGVAAALTMGAAAVQIGTAFLLCPEVETSALHRTALKSDRATTLTNVFTGRPARSIVNRIVQELGPISTLAPDFPLASGAIAPLKEKAEALGSSDFSALWSGQNRIGCKEISAKELVRELACLV